MRPHPEQNIQHQIIILILVRIKDFLCNFCTAAPGVQDVYKRQVHISDTISIFAEIGVVLLMFSTGLGTNLKELIKAGPIATPVSYTHLDVYKRQARPCVPGYRQRPSSDRQSP